MLPPFAEHLDADRIHVQAPAAVIFLCGGETSPLGDAVPRSIRDAFLKINDNPATRNRVLIQAEDINVFYLSRAAYTDFLKFETDLAQITELVILICESPGSLVELGAFSMLPEIAERLFVVMRNKHYAELSFVRLGPILSLQNRYGESTIYVLDDDDINIVNDSVVNIDKGALRDRLSGPISAKISQMRNPTTFDAGKSGHLIKLIVGLIQEYGALTVAEIEVILIYANVLRSQAEISAYLLCAEAVGWVKQEKKGLNTYFFALPGDDAAILVMKDGAPVKKKVLRRQMIRDHWKDVDPDRFRGIAKFLGGAA